MARTPDDRHPYLKVAAELRAQIMSGTLAPGAQLPSTRQLAETYGVPPATIQNAVGMLKTEGYLEGHAGKGVYVRPRRARSVDVSAYFAPSPGGYSYQLLEVDAAAAAPVDVAQALELEDGQTAILRRRLLLLDGEPVELSWSYYPASIAAGSALAAPGKIRGGAPRVLAELGYPERRMVDRLSVRPPTTLEAEELEIPQGVSVIRQFRVIYSDDERPVEASVLVKPGHLYELVYEQDVPASE
ncbi:GntR family transcriptional regulator [Planobispora siamensis]|uniref:GntR family transcriptional regulator n=1 Tax=Planobispora siamensis TaxID=936338 RepID=A0A8J3SEM1_9ACTN|nr:GntR family transcriptional regulator [Planobispora siamensis]GIH91904.1 GntR family transcriptional regulator [Planobispora siamensis]